MWYPKLEGRQPSLSLLCVQLRIHENILLLSLNVTLVPWEKVTFEMMFSEPSLWALNLYFSSLYQFWVFCFLLFSMFLVWRSKLEKLRLLTQTTKTYFLYYDCNHNICFVGYSRCCYSSSSCLSWIGKKYEFPVLSMTALQKTWKINLESHRLVPNPD